MNVWHFTWCIVFAFSNTFYAQDLRYENNQTLTYEEVIEAYQQLDNSSPHAVLRQFGPTDSGHPLHVLFLSADELTENDNIESWKKDKAVILINNGIHPGESCGIDASIAYARKCLQKGIPEKVLVAIIPVYNIGGALNRGAYSRANQQGPEEHGFRGNARNLDLNRDFIKADALNTLSFYAIFHLLNPHIFVDTHTSNGADYQYTMTLISTQKDKLNPVLAEFLTQKLEPELYTEMEGRGWPMIPYVNVFGNTPDQGYAAFLETPRYASGYTTLFNTIGFITEAHMLKPYKDRVEATLSFLEVIIEQAAKRSEELLVAQREADEADLKTKTLDIAWKLDETQSRKMDFKGYQAEYLDSKVTSGKRLHYDRSVPYQAEIDYYDTYIPTQTVNIPEYYVVPAAWHRVPQLLQYNGVEMLPLEKDTTLTVETSYVTDFEFKNTPYEGHFFLTKVKTESRIQQRQFLKGDYLVPTQQKAKRFIVSVLEPEAVDSYLRWNFYDEIFQQKEYFSAYVFEDTAEELLLQNEDLKKRFEEWRMANPELAKSPEAQLHFIYQNSPYYEKEHLRYPVARFSK